TQVVDQSIGLGLDEYAVVVQLGARFVLDGIRGNQRHLAIQGTVAIVVIGRNLDLGFLSGTDERDVTRRNPRFDQQLVIQRHNGQQLAVGRNYTALGGHGHVLDDTAHRGAQRHARQGIGTPAHYRG